MNRSCQRGCGRSIPSTLETGYKVGPCDRCSLLEQCLQNQLGYKSTKGYIAQEAVIDLIGALGPDDRKILLDHLDDVFNRSG